MEFNRRSFLKASVCSALQVGIVSSSYAESIFSFDNSTIKQSFPRTSPEAVGVNARAILDFLSGLEHVNAQLHSLMIVKQGKVIAEGWWSPYRADLKHTLYSLSKSFTSTAIGLAVAEGRLSVHDQVISFFKEQQPAHISSNLAAMRVRDLLSMTTGHSTDTLPRFRDTTITDWVKDFLAQPVTHQPGTHFLYNSGATYMLSAIIQKITGHTLLDYLTPRLFAPLGIEDMDWEVDPKGICVGGWGLRLKTEDIAKFGQLYLQEGTWNGKQIIPRNWIKEATLAHIMQAGKEEDREKNDWLQGYGYQFWRCQHNAYRGDGAYGQYCIVLPDSDMVIAITSETPNMQVVLDQVWKYLVVPTSTEKMATETASQKLVNQRLKDLSLPLPKGLVTSKSSFKIHKKQYLLQENNLGISAISFDTSVANTIAFTVADRKGTHVVKAGINAWIPGKSRIEMDWLKLIPAVIPNDPELAIVSTVHWTNAQSLEWYIRFVDTAHYAKFVLSFTGKEIKISAHKSVSLMSGELKPYTLLEGTYNKNT